MNLWLQVLLLPMERGPLPSTGQGLGSPGSSGLGHFAAFLACHHGPDHPCTAAAWLASRQGVADSTRLPRRVLSQVGCIHVPAVAVLSPAFTKLSEALFPCILTQLSDVTSQEELVRRAGALPFPVSRGLPALDSSNVTYLGQWKPGASSASAHEVRLMTNHIGGVPGCVAGRAFLYTTLPWRRRRIAMGVRRRCGCGCCT